jgi:hypothetical protein
MGIVTKIDRAAAVNGPATAISERMSRRHAAPPRHGASDRPAGGATSMTGADALAAELRRLDALRRHGVITAEEHALAKAKLVGL